MVRTDLEGVPRSARVAAVAAVLLALGAFLPWAVEAGESYRGVHGAVQDGYVTLGIAVVVGATTVARGWDRGAHLVAAGGGLGALALFDHWYGPVSARVSAEPGAGLYLTLLGGLGLLAAAAYAQFEDRGSGEETVADVRREGDESRE